MAPRLILFGHQFNKYVSAQISYMRPVDWVTYKNINGDQSSHSVWMNVGGLTIATHFPLTKKLTVFGEAGLGVITRKGFEIDYKPVIKNATYATGLFGGALQYHLNKRWELQLSTAWSPANKKEKQPQITFYSAGFNYHLKELSKEKTTSNIRSGYYFAKHFIQASYTTNAPGYGVNDLFSKTLPLFWGGAAHLKEGFSVNYQRNVFHARKVFSPKTDLFFEYTVAGPTYISKTLIDNETTGKKFTFYDAMGIGMFTGKKKNLNAGLRIAHFSNGNIFSENNGVKVPLTFSLGYVLN